MAKLGKYTKDEAAPPASKHGTDGGNGGYAHKTAVQDVVDPRKQPADTIAGNARGKGPIFRVL